MSDAGIPGAPAAPAPAPAPLPASTLAAAFGVPSTDSAINNSAAASFAKVVTGDAGSSEAATFDALFSGALSPSDYKLELGQHMPDLPVQELSKFHAEAAQYVFELGLPPHLATRLMNSTMEGLARFHASTPEQQALYHRQTGARLKEIFGDRVADAIVAADALIGTSDFAQRMRPGLLCPESMHLLILHTDRKALRATMK